MRRVPEVSWRACVAVCFRTEGLAMVTAPNLEHHATKCLFVFTLRIDARHREIEQGSKPQPVTATCFNWARRSHIKRPSSAIETEMSERKRQPQPVSSELRDLLEVATREHGPQSRSARLIHEALVEQQRAEATGERRSTSPRSSKHSER